MERFHFDVTWWGNLTSFWWSDPKVFIKKKLKIKAAVLSVIGECRCCVEPTECQSPIRLNRHCEISTEFVVALSYSNGSSTTKHLMAEKLCNFQFKTKIQRIKRWTWWICDLRRKFISPRMFWGHVSLARVSVASALKIWNAIWTQSRNYHPFTKLHTNTRAFHNDRNKISSSNPKRTPFRPAPMRKWKTIIRWWLLNVNNLQFNGTMRYENGTKAMRCMISIGHQNSYLSACPRNIIKWNGWSQRWN